MSSDHGEEALDKSNPDANEEEIKTNEQIEQKNIEGNLNHEQLDNVNQPPQVMQQQQQYEQEELNQQQIEDPQQKQQQQYEQEQLNQQQIEDPQQEQQQNNQNVIVQQQNPQDEDIIQIEAYKQPKFLLSRFDKSPMVLSDPVIQEGMKKYVIYTVTGSVMPPGATRRFSDFYSLREKLVERWPGIYIPNVPPKKVVKNLENKNIESRMRHLNLFCLKLSKFKAIFECEEMQLFQSNNSDIGKLLDKLLKLTSKDILQRFQEAYPDFYEAYDLTLGKAKLSEFFSFIKKAMSNLKYFKETVVASIVKKNEEFTDYFNLLHGFENYEKQTLLEHALNDEKKLIFFNSNNTTLAEKILKLKDNLSNPYVLLDEWLDEEKLDLEAMVQALEQLISMNENLEKLKQKRDSTENSIKGLQFGHKDMKTIFSFKNKDATLAELEQEKVKLEEEIANLSQIIKLASFNMECYIEVFKEEKLNEYYTHLKMFCEMQKNNSIYYNEIWTLVAKSLRAQADSNN